MNAKLPLLLSLLLLTAEGARAQSTLEQIKSSNTAVLGIAGEVPYAYVDENGRLTGEAPEIARVVFERIDPEIEVEAVRVPFGELIPALKRGLFDVIAAGMFITPERCADIAFSDPTYVVGEAFAVKDGNPKNITSYEAISDNPEARVGLVAGTVEYNYTLVTGIPADRALLYRDFEKALEGLKAGEVDAIGLTSLTVQEMTADEPGLEATRQFYPELEGEEVKGYGGFGFRPEDEALRQAFDRHLDAFIGTPEHKELVAPFGFTEEMMPDRTAQELCASETG